MNKRRFIIQLLVRRSSFPRSLWLHAGLLAVLLVAFVIPQIQSMVGQYQLWSETAAQASIVDASTTQHIQTSADVAQLEHETILDTAILSEDQVVAFIEVFEHAAQETGVRQQVNLLTGQRVTQSHVARIPAEIILTGSWDQLTAFLGFIEAAPFSFNITALAVEPAQPASDEYTMTISANTFWKPL